MRWDNGDKTEMRKVGFEIADVLGRVVSWVDKFGFDSGDGLL